MGHWIILPVVLPAILAGITVLAARHDLIMQRSLSLAGTAGFLAVALWLALHADQPEVYRLGNWPAPFGIVLVLDGLSALMLVLLGAVALPVLLYVIGTEWDTRGQHFHALYLFQLMGLGGAFLTGDAFNLFVFFEVLLIASYGLMIHGGGEVRLRAGLQYVVVNLVGSTLFLFALATIYALTGTLNMADLAGKWAALPAGDQALARAAAAMLLLVFAVKGALVPLQFWLPGTYANAPGVVAALFAVMTKVGAYATLRFGTLVFPPDLAATGPLLQDLIQPAALITLAVGAIGVLGATTLPRLAAFAGIASMGTAFLAISAYTPQTTSAALYYILHSTLATAALFLVADFVARRRAHVRLADPAPITRTGLIASLYMAAAIALAGMPPLSGFIGKLLILDAFRAQAPLVWTVILVSSFLMILGFARAGSQIFWKPAPPEDTPPEDPGPEPLAFAATLALLAGLAALTVFAGPVTDALTATAEALHNPQAYIDAARLGATP